jgi:hypothetical protein
VLNNIPPDILVFILTDPFLIANIPDLNDLNLEKIFKKHYLQFTVDRINKLDEVKKEK